MVEASPTPPRLFLIDAYALIYRSFFAFINRPLTNSRGENTSAPWGFINFLLTIREEYDPDYLAVVFDSGLSHREKEYPDYKATREKMPDELRASLPRIRALIEAFNDEVVELDGYEADDVIGTLALKARASGIEAVVVSGDKDFHQLVGPGIHLLNPGRGGPTGVGAEWIDETNAMDRLGIAPNQVVDFLALVGDASDNVPGAPGVGAGWARRLLNEIGPLEKLLEHPEQIPWKSKRESLSENGAQILLSKRLVTIQTDLPVELDLERLEVRDPDVDRLRKICGELEFYSLIERFSSEESGSIEPEGGELDYRLLTEIEEVREAVDVTRSSGRVAIETLTTSTDPMKAVLVGLSLSWSEGLGVYLPLRHEAPQASLLEGESSAPGNLPALDDSSMAPLVQLLSDAGVAKVGHDLKYHLIVLQRAGVELGAIDFDPMVASYVLDPGRRQHTLEVLSTDFLGRTPSALTDITGKGKKRIPISQVSPETASVHACEASDLALRLWARFEPTLLAQKMDRVFRTLEMPLLPVLAEMQRVGIRIDPPFFAEMSVKLERELQLVRDEIFKEAGESSTSTRTLSCERSCSSSLISQSSSGLRRARRRMRPRWKSSPPGGTFSLGTCSSIANLKNSGLRTWMRCPNWSTPQAGGSTPRSTRRSLQLADSPRPIRTYRTFRFGPRSGGRFEGVSSPKKDTFSSRPTIHRSSSESWLTSRVTLPSSQPSVRGSTSTAKRPRSSSGCLSIR